MPAHRVLLAASVLAGVITCLAPFAAWAAAAGEEARPEGKPRAEVEPPGELEGASALSPELQSSIESIESRLVTLRSLPFLSKVKTSALSREGARAYLADLLHKEFPPSEMQAEEETLRYFGFLGEHDKAELILLSLLESQVAGVYDPERRTLYVVPGPVTETAALVHELAHALDDQHFDIKRLQDRVKEDDDRALALSCLVEGEATMVLSLWALQSGLDPDAPPLLGGDTEEAMKAAQAGMSGAPVYVRETLIFPYLGGSVWASEIMKRGGGLKAVDPYFREPPDSTEQILHPGKSQPPRDVPSGIGADLLRQGVPAEAPFVKTNTMGEFTIRLLLGKPGDKDAERAAEGWDGDRYLLAGGRGARILAWVSVWDTESDAAEFRDAIAAWGRARTVALDAEGRANFAAEQRGRVVIVAEGGDPSGPRSAAGRASALASRLPSGIELR